MLFAQRRPLHRALASWYEQTITADPITYYTQLAHHWQQAEDSTQAIYYLEKAGERARQQGDFERAMQLYHEALRLEAETAV